MTDDATATPPAPAEPGPAFIPLGRAVEIGAGWRWIAEGWRLFAREPLMCIALLVVVIVGFVVLGLLPVVGSIATTLLTPVVAGGLFLGCRDLAHGRALTFEHLLGGFRQQTGSLVLVGLLGAIALAVVVGVAVGVVAIMAGLEIGGVLGSGGPIDPGRYVQMGAQLALVVLVGLAAMIPVAMATWFAPVLVMLHGCDAFGALRASFFGCLKNLLPFLWYGVILVVLSIVATIPAGLGWLILAPVLFASIYTAYREIYFAA